MKLFQFFLAMLFFLFSISAYGEIDRIERLKSRAKRGVDYYRDGRFTISSLSKQALSSDTTAIRGFITNDTNRRAVSVQLEVTCYNAAGDLLGTELVELSYLNAQETQAFQTRFRHSVEEITLFEALIQDALFEDF